MIGDREVTTHVWEANLLQSDGTEGTIRKPESGRFTLDESWSPFGQGSLVFEIGSAPELRNLDPDGSQVMRVDMTRNHGRSRIVADFSGAFPIVSDVTSTLDGETVAIISDFFEWGSFDGRTTRPNGTDGRALPRLMVRSRELDPEAGTVTIGLATRDAILHDRAHASSTVPELFPPEGMTLVKDLVNWVLAAAADGEQVGLTSGDAETATFVREDNPWQNGQTAIEYLAPILQRVNLVLWCDVNGQWKLAPEVTPSGLTPLEGTLSSAGTLVSTRELIDLDRTVTQSVLVVYEWTDSAGTRQTRYDAAQVPGGPTRRPQVFRYERPWPGPGAAARILSQLVKRRRAVPVEAVSDYRVSPGMRLTVGSPIGDVRGYVRSVTWSVPDDRMTIVTRDVEALPEN